MVSEPIIIAIKKKAIPRPSPCLSDPIAPKIATIGPPWPAELVTARIPLRPPAIADPITLALITRFGSTIAKGMAPSETPINPITNAEIPRDFSFWENFFFQIRVARPIPKGATGIAAATIPIGS